MAGRQGHSRPRGIQLRLGYASWAVVGNKGHGGGGGTNFETQKTSTRRNSWGCIAVTNTTDDAYIRIYRESRLEARVMGTEPDYQCAAAWPRAPSSTRTSWPGDLVSLHLGLD